MMIIDRFEGDYAVAERDDGSTVDIAVSLLPENVKEGDIVSFTFDGYVIDEEATAARREEIFRRLQNLTGGNNG